MALPTQKKLGSVVIGAIKTGQDQFLDFIMMAGFSPDSRCKDGKTLTHHAAEFAVQTGDPEPLRKLVRYGANLYLRDKNNRTVLDVLRAIPRLENEVRGAWLDGSGNLGVRDSLGGRNGGALGGGGKQKGLGGKGKPKGDGGSAQVLGQVRALRGKLGKKPQALFRPDEKDSGVVQKGEAVILKIS